MHGLTPSQTIGPFFSVMRALGTDSVVAAGSEGALIVRGTVFDGDLAPVTDALVEIWQADRSGHYRHPEDSWPEESPGDFSGFARCLTNSLGGFSFTTFKPGVVPGFDERKQAPHIVVSVFARGLLRRLVTRLYFPDERHANSIDPVLRSIADAAARETLIAKPDGNQTLRFDIHLRGEKETAFFAV